MQINIRSSYDSFRELRENKAYYIDKTDMIEEYLVRRFEKAFRNFQIVISTICDEHEELLKSEKVREIHKEFFIKLQRKESNEEDTIHAIALICQMLRDHYGKQVFVIVDEYDVPMVRAYGTPAYDKIRDMIEHMLSFICKTNDNVKAVMLSGCLYTVKNSTYSGVNNIIPYTVLSPLYASSIGFTVLWYICRYYIDK